MVEHPKREVNIGTLVRSAFNFGAAAVATVGRRYEKQAGDTGKFYRHMPIFHYRDWDQYAEHAPFAWEPIAVELVPTAIPLLRCIHPKSAVYLLGREDGSLSERALLMARLHVYIPSLYCLNVAVAGSIVMYDRIAKHGREAVVPRKLTAAG